MTLDNERVTRDLFLMLAGATGFLRLHAKSGMHWCPVDDVRCFERWCEAWSYDGDLSVGLVPWMERSEYWTVGGSVFWAHTDSGGSSVALDSFGVKPTLVVREGSTSRRTALWALAAPLTLEWVERGNRRIAHELGTAKKRCGRSGEVFVPGTILRKGRKRPVGVHLEHFDPKALYTAKAVVGHLRDAPDPGAWKRRQDAA
jgi:hypothetical protein